MAEVENREDKRLFLLDAMALIYRAYFAFNSKNPMVNSKGVNTSAMFGFVTTLLDLFNKENPTHIAIAFDPRNFNLLTYQNHQRWESGDRKNMKIYKKNQETMQMLNLEYYGK